MKLFPLIAAVAIACSGAAIAKEHKAEDKTEVAVDEVTVNAEETPVNIDKAGTVNVVEASPAAPKAE